MGREVKRVPVDFDHPMNEVWPGFLRKDGATFPPCPDCRWGRNETIMDRLFPHGSTSDPTGLTREAYAVSSTFYAHQIGGPMADVLAWADKLGQAEVDMLVRERRIGMRSLWDRVDLPEPYETNEYGDPVRFEWVRNDRPGPTAAEVNAVNGRGGHPFTDGHHDAINCHLLVRFRCEQLGIAMACPTCEGHNDIATAEERAAEEAAAEAWKPTDPPAGDGWQLWETVSEGSPISPVFPTAEGLAQWMTENRCTVNGPMSSYDAALRFVHAGWAPSFMASAATGVVAGTEWVGGEPS